MNIAARHASTLLVIVIGAGTLIVATFGEYALGVLGWAFSEELGVSTAMIGILTAVMFGASGVASFIVGSFADRVSPPMLALLTIVLAAAVFVPFAFVQSETGLVVSCVLIGAVMALCGPLTNRLVKLYLPPTAHATAITFNSLGPQLGAMFAGFAFGGLAEIFNWRLIVIALSIVMVLFGVYCYIALRSRVYYEPLSAARAVGVDGVHEVAVEAEERTRAIAWWLIPFSFFSGGAVSSIGAYIPLYASDVIGLSIAQAGVAATLVAGVCIVARFLWVATLRVLDFVTVLVVGNLAAAVATVVLALAPELGAPFFWLAIVLVGATALGISPVSQIVLVGATSRKQLGFVSAMNGVGMYAGFTFQPLAIAFLIDQVGFAVSWYAMAASAIIAALIIVVYAMVYGKPKGPHIERRREAVTIAIDEATPPDAGPTG